MRKKKPDNFMIRKSSYLIASIITISVILAVIYHLYFPTISRGQIKGFAIGFIVSISIIIVFKSIEYVFHLVGKELKHQQNKKRAD